MSTQVKQDQATVSDSRRQIQANVLRGCLALDLSLTRRKAVAVLGWDESTVLTVEAQYKRFLFLCYKYPGSVIPSKEIDALWELHLLDTRQYAADCMQVFGFFIHHDPYVLQRNPEMSRQLLLDRFSKTKFLFSREFSFGIKDAQISDCPECIPDYDPPSDPEPLPDGISK